MSCTILVDVLFNPAAEGDLPTDDEEDKLEKVRVQWSSELMQNPVSSMISYLIFIHLLIMWGLKSFFLFRKVIHPKETMAHGFEKYFCNSWLQSESILSSIKIKIIVNVHSLIQVHLERNFELLICNLL